MSTFPEPPLRLFVYGTLKSGYCNHDRYCRHAFQMENAWLWGRLYHLPEGYPALEIPTAQIVARGSSDPKYDARLQKETASQPIGLQPSKQRPAGDWGRVRGETFLFSKPQIDLPLVDQLEDFVPNRPSLYQRVLVPIFCDDVPVLSWVYVMETVPNGRRLYSEIWEGESGF